MFTTTNNTASHANVYAHEAGARRPQRSSVAARALCAYDYPPNAPVVFISYARRDAQIAWTLAVTLRGMGFSVIFDRLHLLSGDRWRERIEAAIRVADVFVLVWSSHARRSPPVRWEVACARARLAQAEGRFHVLPISIEAIRKAKLPPGLEALHVPEPPKAWT